MSGLKIGVIGATGMVGRQYLEILEQSPLEIAQLRLYASARSVGSRMTFAMRWLSAAVLPTNVGAVPPPTLRVKP